MPLPMENYDIENGHSTNRVVGITKSIRCVTKVNDMPNHGYITKSPLECWMYATKRKKIQKSKRLYHSVGWLTLENG
jgi:hypothetical protein